MSSSLLQTYAQFPITLIKGKGSFVWDKNNKKYLDFYGGHAVCLLGHCPSSIIKALAKQSRTLIFYSNIFKTLPAEKLAEELAATLLPKKYQVYFCNSGSEANETAIKIARKITGKTHLLSFHNSFHGRSITCLAATGISSYHQFKPDLLAYTSFATLGDLDSVKKNYNKDTAAIICEPIQSIGGAKNASIKFYQDLARFCHEKKILLIFDEVQAGLGRTGTFWYSQKLEVQPDIITTAKGLASGLPLGAVLVKKEISQKIKVGEQATTFGGGPIVCNVGLAVLKILTKPGFLNSVKSKSAYLKKELKKIPAVKNIHGEGLLLGVELENPPVDFVQKGLKAGIIFGSSHEKNIFRLIPPLTISYPEINLFLQTFTKLLA